MHCNVITQHVEWVGSSVDDQIMLGFNNLGCETKQWYLHTTTNQIVTNDVHWHVMLTNQIVTNNVVYTGA